MTGPRLVTITGIDVHTDLARAKDLCSRYPLEFAMLCDPEREGHNTRVPEAAFAAVLGEHFARHELAFHLCGGYSEQALRLDIAPLDAAFGFSRVRRLQVNAPDYTPDDYACLRRLGAETGCTVIAQNTAPTIPFVDGVLFLDDQSAGRGKVPAARAAPDPRYEIGVDDAIVGYAGGLSPQNLAAQLREIDHINSAVPFWIDAASGVRDANNRLDLDRVERFLDIAFRLD